MRTDRRTFMRQLGVAIGATPLFLSASARAEGPNDKLNVAFIATGGMGGAHVNEMNRLGQNCVCFADVDTNMHGHPLGYWPKATPFQDYRVMFDKMAGQIDAVMIGTPDHHHYPASVMAMQLGLHTYTQKPLTHTPWEARELARLAAANPKIVTQMGNQGHAGDAWRVLYEYVKAGLIGDVTEIHTWTNRPVWPQGLHRPHGSDPVPENLDWDVWLGPAPKRPYKEGAYHTFVWRGWRDFGCGALGDMACHTMDGMFWTMDPGHPTSAEPIVVNNLTSECHPNSAIVKWTFPAKDGRPGFVQYWYEGGLKPDRPEDLEEGREMPGTGSLWVGTKGKLIVPGDYGGGISTIPEPALGAFGTPPVLLPRCPDEDHYKEFVRACKGEGKTMSNFGYAGPMTETILLGVIAMYAAQPLEYDAHNMRFPNCPEADKYISKHYPPGWAFGVGAPAHGCGEHKPATGTNLPPDHPLTRRLAR
jgi:predicted dehydrogenase